MSLAEARTKRDDARQQLRAGIDPNALKKEVKAARIIADLGTVEKVAQSWLDFKSAGWAEETQRKAKYVVDQYIIPQLGKRKIADLRTADVAPMLASMSKGTPDVAKKARQYVNGIVRYAIRNGLREDGRLLSLEDALPRSESGHHPAATLPQEIGEVMAALKAYPSPVTRGALLICAYTAMRPGVAVQMEWSEIHGDEWHVPAKKMKKRRIHIVSLPTQVLDVLDDMRRFSGGEGYVFPPLARQKNPHLNRDSLSSALRDMGFRGKQTPHGFRATMRTAARERLKVDSDVLQAQLAHAKQGNVAKAYDRTTFDDERREAMQTWANWLDEQSDAATKRNQ